MCFYFFSLLCQLHLLRIKTYIIQGHTCTRLEEISKTLRVVCDLSQSLILLTEVNFVDAPCTSVRAI